MKKQTVLSKYFTPPSRTTIPEKRKVENEERTNEPSVKRMHYSIEKVQEKKSPTITLSNSKFTGLNEPVKRMHYCMEEWNDEKSPTKQSEPYFTVLEPGIVLLKKFLSVEEQQFLADLCFEKGENEKSGFYKPKVMIWNKLCQMKINQMCMGLHWNARVHKYETTRSDHDNLPVHPLPEMFREICKKVVTKSISLDPTNIPSSSPNSCIVNFYDEGCVLGFHRDVSESKKSIKEGKPVISLSIGASADFQYYYRKNTKADRKTILLESGDALVFGGPARLIYHGVPKVHITKIPHELKLKKKGRLNITFREW
eukprot:Phypoly_transcript_10636.p1 GENE.Phypoly_transcript_10636~~Phypoly_transcript_10636.p1  ORF type:complete len:312 (+),score=41.96 Phypoly_transcript_10636:259-1194(+)